MPTTDTSRKAALDSDYTPFYVAAGLADLALETIKITITRQLDEAKARQAQLRTFSTGLPEQLRQLPELAREQLALAQKQAGITYADVAGRGKVAVDEAIATAKKLQAQTTARATKAADEAVTRVADVTDAVDDAAEDAKKTTSTARAAAARKSGGAATAAKKASTTRKPATRKAR